MFQVENGRLVHASLPFVLNLDFLAFCLLTFNILAFRQQYIDLRRYYLRNSCLSLILRLVLVFLFHFDDKPSDLAMALIVCTVFNGLFEEVVHLEKHKFDSLYSRASIFLT